MKKKLVYVIIVGLLVVAGLLILAYSCENYDDMIPSEYNKILSIKEVGEIDITLYNTGEDGSYNMTIMKGGYLPDVSAQAELSVMGEIEFALYSETIGKTYTILPSSMYEIKEPAIFFTPQDLYQNRIISFKTTAINDLLKENTVNYVLPIMLWSSTDSVNAQKELVILKPKVVVPKVSYEVNTATVSLKGSSTTYEFRLTLPFASLWDFECTVELDPNATPSGYMPMPDDLYTIADGSKVTFKKGNNRSEPLEIKINDADLLGNAYIIPLKVVGTTMSGFAIPTSAFILYSEFNKIQLTEEMLSTNAQEVYEGPIANLIDDDPDTFFHTAWSFSIKDPHYLQIKLDNPISKCMFVYQNRNNSNGKPMEAKIMVSSNGDDWEELAHIDSNMPTEPSSIYSSEEYTAAGPFTYFRFEVYRTNSGSAPTFFNMAEFALYGK